MTSDSSSYSEALSDNTSSVLVCVSNDLMQLIKDPEQKEESSVHLTTMNELLIHVKNYIVKHKLYDPDNPLKICVHENKLGSVLGKTEFSIFDVRDILFQKCVFPVTKKHSAENEAGSDKMLKKRKLCVEENAKKLKGSDSSFDSDESNHSIQGYETELVQDSSSEDNFSIDGLIIAETFDVDVEIETDNDFSCESESDIEDIVKSAIITFIARSSEADVAYLADESSDETSEKEISEEDKWHCSSCFMLNDPIMRYCAICWLPRVGWLSERDEIDMGKRKVLTRSKRKLSKKNKDSSNRNFSDLPVVTTERLISPSSCSDNSGTSNLSSNTSEADNICSKNEIYNLCIFCCSKPADSSIIHGRVGCRVCCFKCGTEMFAENKRCPVCRRIIERIVYLYNS